MKIGFVSLGCPKNLVDSEVMMGELSASGHELTSRPAEADIIVVNTCSFIDPAKQESIDTILEMAEYKKTGRAQKLIVAGCLAERYRGDIQKNMPEVDAVIGTNEIDRIVALCEGGPASALAPEPYLYHDLTPRVLATPRHFAYLKISEGCDHPCSFCVIPQYRGKNRSRRLPSVLNEASRLFDSGVREINLIGQDTTAYGEDLGIKNGLASLLAQLAELPSAQGNWIRFLYAYPNRVSQELLDTLAVYPNLCSYIDLPLQHASSSVLRRMKRGGSADIFLRLIEKIRKTIPGVTLRTSFIAGFPGETEADFQELLKFIETAQFDRLGVFGYSDEDTSESFHLDGKVGAKLIYNRKRSVMALQKRISRKKHRGLAGMEFPVLLEGPSAETPLLWECRTQGQAPEIDGTCYVNDLGEGEAAPGQMRRLRVTETHDYDLIGELVDVAETRLPVTRLTNPFPIVTGSRPEASIALASR